MKNKKILFVGHDASLTGAPKSLIKIIKILTQNGFDAKCILRQSGPLSNEYQDLCETKIWYKNLLDETLFHRLIFKIKGGQTAHEKAIVKWVHKYNPDFIFNNTIVNGSILESLKYLNKPIISRIPELESVIQMFNINGESQKVLNLSNHFIAVSNSVKNNLITNHNIDEVKISLLYGAVESIETSIYIKEKEKIKAELDLADNSFVVGAVGSLIYRKGIDFFIETAEVIAKSNIYSDIKFVWVGANSKSGLYFEVLQDIKKRGLMDKIVFVEQQKDIYPYYAIFDLYFMCSREDPFPLTMIEAANFGLPIIGFKNTGGVEEFVDDSCGFLIEYANIFQCAQSIMTINRNKELIAKCKENIKSKAQTFNSYSLKNKLFEIFEKL